MKLFGLTGGIGMGKSTAGLYLAGRGLPVIDTDQLARQVVAPGQPALAEIARAFGPQIIGPSGHLQRAELARRVFSSPADRHILESITHPRIRTLWRQHADSWRRQGAPIGIVIIPLLFETGAEKELNATVCVACSEATQHARLAPRGWSPDQAAARIAAQWPVERKMARADFLAWSEGPPFILHAQLDRIFR
ncbi:MAG: dephospho-CoA kinase [Verrucomicrobiota bacterium]